MQNFLDNLNRKRSLLALIVLTIFLFLYYTQNTFFRRPKVLEDFKAALNKKNENQNSLLPIYNLIVDPASLKKLEKSTTPFQDHGNYYFSQPLKNQSYESGRFISKDSGKVDVKVKYRGDNYFHWGKKKKSWRVKFKQDELFFGRRKINLNNPKFPSQMENFLGYTYANLLNVMGPYSYYVHTRLNRQYLGVMLFVEQIDKYFLINHRLPEGKIYYLEKGEAWTDASLWEKPSSVFSVQKNTKDAELEHFLNVLSIEDDARYYNEVKKILHLPSVLRWHAFSSYFGVIHQDSVHNHKFIFDPSRGKFLPLLWDPVLGIRPKTTHEVSKRESTLDVSNPVLSKLMANPSYNLAKNRLLWSFYSKELPFEKQIEIYQNTYRSIEPDIVSDNLKEYTYCDDSGNWRLTNSFWKSSLKGIEKLLKKRKFVIEQEIDNVTVEKGSFFVEDKKNHTDLNLKFYHANISGIRIKSIESELSEAVKKAVFKVELNAPGYTTKPILLCDSESECKKFIDNKNINLPIGLASYAKLKEVGFGKVHSQHLAIQRELTQSPVVLNLKFYSKYKPLKLSQLKVNVENLVTNKAYQFFLEKGEVNISSNDKKQLLFKEHDEEKEVIVWSEDQIITEKVYTINEKQKLIIKPGINVKFAKGSSLFVEGDLEIQGEKHEPVVFSSQNENEAWGSVAVSGDDQKTVSIEHAKFIGGSELNKDFVRYSGMLSIYHANANINNVGFFNNFGEDALNIKYGRVNASKLMFSGIFSDAFDCDFCELNLLESEFTEIKNDAIDLSYTDAHINMLKVKSAGDKGVSLGERSRAILRDYSINNSKLGIAIKDESFLNVEECSNVSNIVMYNKKNEFMNAGCMLSSNKQCLSFAQSINENSKKLPLKVHSVENKKISLERLKSFCSRDNDFDKMKKNISWVDLN